MRAMIVNVGDDNDPAQAAYRRDGFTRAIDKKLPLGTDARSVMRSMITALWALLLLPCACLHGQETNTEAGQADKAYRQAMSAGDVVVLARLITDDFLFIRRTGEIWDRKAFLEVVQARKLVADVQEKDLKARIYGDTVIFTHMDFLKTPDGGIVEMIATRVFVKQRGSWKLASVQDTALPARQPNYEERRSR